MLGTIFTKGIWSTVVMNPQSSVLTEEAQWCCSSQISQLWRWFSHMFVRWILSPGPLQLPHGRHGLTCRLSYQLSYNQHLRINALKWLGLLAIPCQHQLVQKTCEPLWSILFSHTTDCCFPHCCIAHTSACQTHREGAERNRSQKPSVSRNSLLLFSQNLRSWKQPLAVLQQSCDKTHVCRA